MRITCEASLGEPSKYDAKYIDKEKYMLKKLPKIWLYIDFVSNKKWTWYKIE